MMAGYTGYVSMPGWTNNDIFRFNDGVYAFLPRPLLNEYSPYPDCYTSPIIGLIKAFSHMHLVLPSGALVVANDYTDAIMLLQDIVLIEAEADYGRNLLYVKGIYTHQRTAPPMPIFEHRYLPNQWAIYTDRNVPSDPYEYRRQAGSEPGDDVRPTYVIHPGYLIPSPDQAFPVNLTRTPGTVVPGPLAQAGCPLCDGAQVR